jgi:hypothetical protein
LVAGVVAVALSVVGLLAAPRVGTNGGSVETEQPTKHPLTAVLSEQVSRVRVANEVLNTKVKNTLGVGIPEARGGAELPASLMAAIKDSTAQRAWSEILAAWVDDNELQEFLNYLALAKHETRELETRIASAKQLVEILGAQDNNVSRVSAQIPALPTRRTDFPVASGRAPEGTVSRCEIPRGTVITGVRIYATSWIHGIELVASDGSINMFGNRQGKQHVFDLPNGEKLVGFNGRISNECDRIAVVGSMGTKESLGATDRELATRAESAFHLAAPGGKRIVGLHGRTHNTIISLGLIVEDE